MALKKDKQKVLDEVWTIDRVKAFLEVMPAENVDRDFHVLLKAYQAMRLENFREFIEFFVADNRNINARSAENQTLLSIIEGHKNGGEYREVLVANGAQEL